MTDIATQDDRVNTEQREVLDHPDNLCLSAGAGSGKTRTLVEKYLRLLVDDGRAPSEILAITFTEKAAAEMQARIRAALQEMIQLEVDPNRCGDLEDKLMNLGGGWISTIHSFGARLLREHPAEAGIDPAFSPLPEQESQILWESAAVSAVLEMAERDPMVGELSLRLGLHAGGRGSSLVAALLSIKHQLEAQGRRPEEIVLPDPPGGRRLDASSAIQALRRLTGRPEPGATLTKKIPAWRKLAENLSQSPLSASPVLRFFAKAGWDEKVERLKPGGTLKKDEKIIFEELERESAALVAQAAEVAEYDVIATMIRLLCGMWQSAEREKARRRALDFSDLETKTVHLLEHHPDVARTYQDRFKHVLVDEYQDVNPVQARIIRCLAGDRPRCLFAVGDPKQSIYRFRGADVEQFQDLWSEMEKKEAAFQLKRNYRSHPKLVHAVNAFFDGRIFCGRPPVEMEPAKPAPSPPAGGGEEWNGDRPRIQWVSFHLGESRATERREQEARILAERIRRMTERNPRGTRPKDGSGMTSPAGPFAYGDFALLFRATRSLYLYEEAMRAAQIPYELVKAGTAFRSQEVMDILNTLSVIIDPSDKISWLGFLRSPFAGLSDDGVLALCSGEPPLNARDQAAAQNAMALIRQAAIERKTRSPLSLLDWILAESGYLAIVSGLSQPAARRRYVETLRAASTQYGRHRPDPHIAFLNAAWRMVDRNERETGMDPPRTDRVKLMTIHQAKGLEFPVVILPDLLRPEPARPPDFFLVPPSPDGSPLRLAARIKIAGASEKFPTPLWKAMNDRAAAGDSEEQKRLLYVAMTRAEELLILPGPDEIVKGHSVWEMLYQFLKEEREHVEIVAAGPVPVSAASAQPAPLSDRIAAVRMSAPELPPVVVEPSVRSATSFDTAAADHPRRPAERRAIFHAPPRSPPTRPSVGYPGDSLRSPDAFAVSLGTLAHEVLEHADLGMNADDQTLRMREYLHGRFRWMTIPKNLTGRLENNLDLFFHSPLAEKLRQQAPKVRREYPFTFPLKIPGAEEIFIRGKIDLLIFGTDTIEIYDYKYAEATAGFGIYEGQLMAYALAACMAFDLPRVTVGLQFLTGDQALRTQTIEREAAEKTIAEAVRESRETT